VSKSGTATINMTQLHQFRTFTNYFWRGYTLFSYSQWLH